MFLARAGRYAYHNAHDRCKPCAWRTGCAQFWRGAASAWKHGV